jgi:hypothetical protein
MANDESKSLQREFRSDTGRQEASPPASNARAISPGLVAIGHDNRRDSDTLPIVTNESTLRFPYLPSGKFDQFPAS